MLALRLQNCLLIFLKACLVNLFSSKLRSSFSILHVCSVYVLVVVVVKIDDVDDENSEHAK